jgi:DNA topoisomerase-1
MESGKTLIIVESPGKIKTLSKFLGSSYLIEASKGHVIDLPESRIGINIEAGFAPDYRVVTERSDVIRNLQTKARNVDAILFASDPDREGEAISWHLAHLLNIDPQSPCRITFNSITKSEVLKAIEDPRSIDLNLVSAQQSRRILDRLVGYKLSPLLWKKVFMGLSAGRVQSVAVLMICEREREIMAFKADEYWTIKGLMQKERGTAFEAKLMKSHGKKAVVPDATTAEAVRHDLETNPCLVRGVVKRERKQTPPPPFITSTLQQDASQRFSFTPKRTMSIAQKLYEGIELGKEGHVGLITYMRTDSVRISPEALTEAQQYVATRFGPSYELAKPRLFKSRREAQDAHEAIRPTSAWRTPESLAKSLKPEELKLYTLIWRRFIATQMAEALYDVVQIEIESGPHLLQAMGTTMKFDGFTTLYSEQREAEQPETPAGESETEGESDIAADGKQILPEVSDGETLKPAKITCQQHFTQPPPRFNESMLIRTMEKEGIGRPSTYSAIVETIQQRGYVKKVEGRFRPSEAAFLTTEILTSCFGDIINPRFTATMEDLLDKVEDGQTDWLKVLADFYTPFQADLKKAEAVLKKVELSTDCHCSKCGKPMVVKLGRTGKFLACTGYPECKNTENIPESFTLFFGAQRNEEPLQLREKLDKVRAEEETILESVSEVCPTCGAGMVIKSGRFGRFIACTKYPECKTTKPLAQGIGVKCPLPDCSGQMVIKRSKRGRQFYGCSNYPNCKMVTWSPPTGELCPKCNSPLVKHSTKKLGEYVKCTNKACDVKIFPEGETGGKEE